MGNKKILPLAAGAIVVILFVFLLLGLKLNPRELPSPLIGKPVPEFTLPDLLLEKTTLSAKDLKGEISLLNIWATWCPSCLDEHEVLIKIAQTGKVAIYGINWKDEAQKARQWLEMLGNPYIKTGYDGSGDTGINLGVYGAPETYLVGPDGKIIYKHAGAVTWESWQEEFLPRIMELSGA